VTGYKIIVLIHVLFATIWVGGHLILSIGFLPRALKQKDPSIIQQFESKYEPIGLPALVIQVLTGLWLGIFYDSQPLGWFTFRGSLATHLALKVILVVLTLILAIHARLRIIPKLKPENLKALAFHIIAVTLIGVMLLILGVSIRTGGLF
jgi:putative copper export protein